MKRSCKHCGLRFVARREDERFCCDGCRHVYAVINAGGLGDYYARQDRVGQPVGTRHSAPIDRERLRAVLAAAEASDDPGLVLKVRGMSCLGCVWLIEQIAIRSQGVLRARVGLQSNLLSLRWRPGEFDLCELAEELRRFGYELDGSAAAGPRLSPLALRFMLTSLFSLNGILLTVGMGYIGAGTGTGLRPLIDLLLVICLFFAMILGGSLYFRPAWQGIQLRRFHSDLVPSLGLATVFGLALATHFQVELGLLMKLFFFTLITTLTLARWLSDRLALQMENG